MFLLSGIKRAFRSDDDGSVIAPHSFRHLVAIFIAEFVGTFILLFLGCLGLAAAPGDDSKENSNLEGAIVFGIAVMLPIQIIGHTSDAHLNPSVTLCALILGRLRVVTFFVYVAAQFAGAITGVGMLKAVTPNAWNDSSAFGCCKRCVNVPHGSMTNLEAFLGEFMITFILILVVCGVWDRRNTNDRAAPLKFGFTIIGIALAMGAFTGASMNPARSFAPALWEMSFERHWVYWAGPLSAAVCATFLYMFALMKDYGEIKNIYGKRNSEFQTDAPLTRLKGRDAGEPDE